MREHILLGIGGGGTRITRGVCFQAGEHLSLGICVYQVRELISLGRCVYHVSQVGEHIPLVIFFARKYWPFQVGT